MSVVSILSYPGPDYLPSVSANACTSMRAKEVVSAWAMAGV